MRDRTDTPKPKHTCLCFHKLHHVTWHYLLTFCSPYCSGVPAWHGDTRTKPSSRLLSEGGRCAKLQIQSKLPMFGLVSSHSLLTFLGLPYAAQRAAARTHCCFCWAPESETCSVSLRLRVRREKDQVHCVPVCLCGVRRRDIVLTLFPIFPVCLGQRAFGGFP